MRHCLITASALGALSIASASQGGIIVSYINRGAPIGPDGVPATGYTGVVVRLTESTGANITALDLSSGSNGLRGPFVQRWSDIQGDGVYGNEAGENSVVGIVENLTNNVNNFDSHLLPPGNPHNPANFVGIIDHSESIGSGTFVPPPGGTPPFPNNTENFGIAVSGPNGFIKMSFGINGPAQASVYDLAYIVVPNFGTPGADLTFVRGLVAVAGGQPQLLITFPLAPPGGPEPAEPATVIPLGFCAAISLVRPRRKDRRG
jgi:hypothetical protein